MGIFLQPIMTSLFRYPVSRLLAAAFPHIFPDGLDTKKITVGFGYIRVHDVTLNPALWDWVASSSHADT